MEGTTDHVAKPREMRDTALAGGGRQRVADQHARGKLTAFSNFLLMHAMGANTAGQIASTVAGGALLALLGAR